jgi:hypothetical protein
MESHALTNYFYQNMALIILARSKYKNKILSVERMNYLQMPRNYFIVIMQTENYDHTFRPSIFLDVNMTFPLHTAGSSLDRQGVDDPSCNAHK